MIDAAPFDTLTRDKDVEIFAVFLKDVGYELNKKTKSTTDPKAIVPEEYRAFLSKARFFRSPQ